MMWSTYQNSTHRLTSVCSVKSLIYSWIKRHSMIFCLLRQVVLCIFRYFIPVHSPPLTIDRWQLSIIINSAVRYLSLVLISEQLNMHICENLIFLSFSSFACLNVVLYKLHWESFSWFTYSIWYRTIESIPMRRLCGWIDHRVFIASM